ncbi:hypothetical protein ACSQ67_000611 [Phaseolus vulgaris]
MFDSPRDQQPTISFPLSNEKGHITSHSYHTWGATNSALVASKKPSKSYKNCHSCNDMEVQFGTGSKVDDESGMCSPPLWSTSPSKSPHHRKNYYRCLSPASKTQAIARGQRELMEMVKNMPESSYELSLKDLVEHPRVELGQEKGVKGAEERKLNNKNAHARMVDKKGQVKRSGKIDSGGFYLKLVFPISLGSKKKTKNEALVNSCANKVSPRTSLSDGSAKGVDKEWWKKSLSASGGESDSGVSSINSGSMKSSASSNSSSSSRSNSRYVQTNIENLMLMDTEFYMLKLETIENLLPNYVAIPKMLLKCFSDSNHKSKLFLYGTVFLGKYVLEMFTMMSVVNDKVNESKQKLHALSVYWPYFTEVKGSKTPPVVVF